MSSSSKMCQSHSSRCKLDVDRNGEETAVPLPPLQKNTLFLPEKGELVGGRAVKSPCAACSINTVVLPTSGARTDAGVFPTSQAQTTNRPTHSYLKGRLVPCWVHELALHAFACLLIALGEWLFQNPCTRDTRSLM